MCRDLPLPLPFSLVRIQYSGAPGSLQAQVSSVESAGDLVVDSHVQNEGNGWAGSGANPWHLDSDTESILFLTNESSKPARIGFQITASGSAPYFLTKLRLNPHATRAIDIRKLRDAQQPDLNKNTVAPAATDGSVIWVRIDNLPVMGRLMQIHRQAGMASNYDCCICACGLSYYPYLDYITPASSNVAVNGTVPLTFYAGYEDCNGIDHYFNATSGAGWSSGNTSIATVNSSGTVKGQSGGSTSITAAYSDYTYTWDGNYFGEGSGCCEGTLLQGIVSGTVNVYGVQVTSVNVTSDQVGVKLTGPSGASGQLVVTWTGPSGNANIASAAYGPGTYTFNPNLSNLVSGQYTGVTGQWTVNGTPATGSYTTNFYVLGSYTQSQYNTPAESQCTGGTGPGFVTTGPKACSWTGVNMISNFISQAWVNGSGASNSYGLLQEYTTCSAPSGGSSNYFQEVSTISPGCSAGSLGGTTVAWPKSKNSNLQCMDQVLIVGLGTGAGTVKTVTDNCPGCVSTQLDNYSTSNACSLTGLGTYSTIRVNR